jgi:beta-N-acetylhexosaminidase
MTMVSRLLMLDLSGPALTPDERAFMGEHAVGGVCLFARNCLDRFQVAELTLELRALCGEGLLVAIDQEGGSVVRLEDVPYPPSAMALGAADDASLTERVAAATARGLSAVGVNVDFAPVADVNSNPANPVIADRSFGSGPARVAGHVVAFVRGLQQGGVAATVKHFPGHGDTSVDSHLALPVLEADTARLEALELRPFRAALHAGTDAVMTAHILLPALDPERPATLSRRIVTGLLREKLGFEGVVFTDALNMRAVAERYGPAEAALAAVQAGCDMPVHVGPLSEHAAIVRRLERALDHGELDPARVRASLRRLEAVARRYAPRYQPEAAWQEGDEALLDEAAARGLVTVGGLEPLTPEVPLAVVAAREVAAGGASEEGGSPGEALVRQLREAGFAVEPYFYSPDAPARMMAELPRGGVTLFASTSRTLMTGGELELAREASRRAGRFIHVALWNPFGVRELPGPALVAFGFRERTLKAVVRALQSGEARGKAPVPLDLAT